MFKLLLIAGAVVGALATDYCSLASCQGQPHIACGHSGNFASTCEPNRQQIDLSPYISTIVNKHNFYRNKVAGGNLPGFSGAVRMATMVWNPELANLAVLNVKQCKMQHDKCRNTANFNWSGQNLAWYWSSPAANPLTAIQIGIDSWFNEYKDATMADINSYKSSTGVIGHFTPMVNDRNKALGCGLVTQTRSGGTEYFFGCNYAQTNIMGKKTYVSGVPASSCASTNPSYPKLCSVSEPINPNTIY